MAFLQRSAIRSPTDDALRRRSNDTPTPEWNPTSPQWAPEDNTSLSPSEASSRASTPATGASLSNEVKAVICNLENELREAKATAEMNRRKVADLEYKVQQLAADIERERESSERSIDIERNTVMYFRQVNI
ncbi:unnamed protein product [Cylicostephanus goldi]|uniref:Uncharacterized protein n=1 Tax=Cylicostephanus goldi TaxID=71465 RepID=A0A3P7N9T7_CYLGO|nr:unnamed protein product [Cylicostephanus goldi]